MMQDKFYLDQILLCCHGNKIWDKIGFNSACVRDMSEMFAFNRGFLGSGYRMTSIKFYNDQLRDRLSNDVSQILTGPTLVAMATKFDTKQACIENIVVPLAPSRGYLWVGY